jgi:hypothetical protein
MPNYITKAQVHDAADQVNAKGKRPSADSVHAVIGHGSNSTISDHLKTWVPRDQRLDLPPIPDTLHDAVKSLVSDFWHIALTDAGEQFKAKLAKETEDKIEAQTVAAEAGSQIDRLSAELDTSRAEAVKSKELANERERLLDEQKAGIATLQTEVAKKTAQVETLKAMLTEFSPNKKQKAMEFADKA